MAGILNVRHLFRNMEAIINHKLEKALKADNPFDKMDELAQEVFYRHVNASESAENKAIEILERALALAIEEKNSHQTFLFLFKLANFTRQYDKYPQLFELALKKGKYLLAKALVDEIMLLDGRGVVGKSIPQQLCRIMLQQTRHQEVLVFAMPLLKSHLSNQDYAKLLLQIADQAFDGKSFGQAKAFYLELLNFNNKQTRVLENLSHIYISENKLTYALRYFDEVMKQGTQNLELLLYFGSYYYNNKQLSKAKPIYLLIDSIDPEYVEGKRILAEICIREQNHQDALFYLRQVAEYYVKTDKPGLAHQVYERLIAMKADSIPIRMAYVQFLEQEGRFKALKRENLAIGNIYFQKGLYEKALEHFISLQDFADAQGDLYFQRRVLDFIYRIQMKKGNFRHGLATLHTLISVCSRINDLKGYEYFKKELLKTKIKLGIIETHNHKGHGKKNYMREKVVINTLRDIADRVLSEIPDLEKEFLNDNRLFLNEQVDQNSRAELAQAISQRRQKRYHRCRHSLVRIIKQNKSLILPYFHLFHVFMNLNDILSAKKVASAALKIQDLERADKGRLLVLFAYVFYRQKNYAKALKYYSLAQQANSSLQLKERIEKLKHLNEQRTIEQQVNNMLKPLINED